MARERGYTVDIAGFEPRSTNSAGVRRRSGRRSASALRSKRWRISPSSRPRRGRTRPRRSSDTTRWRSKRRRRPFDISTAGASRCCCANRRSTPNPAARSPTRARSSAKAGASTSTMCARSKGGRRRSGDSPAPSTSATSSRECRATGGATRSGITRPRICCTRRCGRCSGDGVHQAGSLVAPDRLRFDFTHHGPVSAERLGEIESIVNREIARSIPVTTREMAVRRRARRGRAWRSSARSTATSCAS